MILYGLQTTYILCDLLLISKVLLPTANVLQLHYVSGACVEFLQKQLDCSNCLGIKVFANLKNCTELLSISEAYIKQHFLYDKYNLISISIRNYL